MIVVAAVVGYLAGSISFARIVGRRRLRGQDLATTEFVDKETGEVWTYQGVSATSVSERGGWRLGLLVVLGDVAKALIPTALFLSIAPDTAAYAVAGLAAMVGHVWPVWWRFEGGRGQATMLGALLVLDWRAVLVMALAMAVIGLVVFTSVYVARNGGPLLLVPYFALWGEPADLVYAIGATLVYAIASRNDLAEEYRIRRARGLPGRTYPARLRQAWTDFFSDD